MPSKDCKLKRGLYKRGRVWCIDVQINGKRVRRAVGSRHDAEAVLAELKKQRALGKANREWTGLEALTTVKVKRTFADVAAEYLADRPLLKPSTMRGYTEILKNYLLPEFGSLDVDQLTETMIARFQAKIAKKLSPVRVNNIMGLLRYVLKVCRRRKVISDNPASAVDSLPEEACDVDPLTIEELELALAVMHPHYRPLFVTLAFTGARPNELLALRWQDVDFARKEIHLRKGRVRGEERTTKTKSSKRVIPMLAIVQDTLGKLFASYDTPPSADAHVFLSKKGVPINKHVDRQWREALKRAGVKHRPSYQLRHTFASYCLQQGCDPGWLAKVLGHATLQTTFKHYARFIDDASKSNEARLEKSLAERPLRE